MNKRLLITGAGGFIGSTLFEQLSDSDWQLIPLVHKPKGMRDEVVVDFCAPDFNATINALPEIDTIIHLGASIGWDGKPRNALFGPNVVATAELANWACKNGIYFIFASAAMVCGIKNPYITSESKPSPDTDYGYSKWLGEEVIKMSGVKSAILRISGVFGRRGPYHLGINKTIDDALNGVIPVKYGDGGIKRNYIYVKDLCSVLRFCCENKVEGIHLVAGSHVNTISEMLQAICDVFVPGKQPIHREAGHNQDQIVECSPIFPRTRSFNEALGDIAKNNGKTSV
jgi:nucleoside-diphosphate-sugar epimerase